VGVCGRRVPSPLGLFHEPPRRRQLRLSAFTTHFTKPCATPMRRLLASLWPSGLPGQTTIVRVSANSMPSPVPNFAVLWKNHVVLIAWRDIQWLWEGNATVIESDLLCLTQTILGCGIAWCDACTIRHNGEKECRSTIPAAFIRRLDPIRTSANTWEVLSARCSQSLIRVRFGRRVTYATSR